MIEGENIIIGWIHKCTCARIHSDTPALSAQLAKSTIVKKKKPH